MFVNANPQSTLKLGQARGVALMCAARGGIAVGEYAARLVKKAVVGTGGADKAQVHAMVARLLPGAKIAGPDAADALAVAITHAHHLATARETQNRHPSCRRAAFLFKAVGKRFASSLKRVRLNLDRRLSGILAETTADGAVIDVGGVGYQPLASARTLDALGPIGGEVLVLTELQVREDAWTLFGFGSAGERDAFRALTSVQGVGGRVALAILSALSPDELARAVAQDDKAMIGRANGVGPKLAARIANELKGKLGVVGLGGGAPAPRAGTAADAVSALANLGFKPAEASAAVNAAQDELGADASLDALVRLALKKAAK